MQKFPRGHSKHCRNRDSSIVTEAIVSSGIGPKQIQPESIHVIFKDASVFSAKVHGSYTDPKVSDDMGKNAPVFAHWLSMILMTSSDLRITFKVFYSNKTARKMAAHSMEVPETKVGNHTLAFYMREYVNLTAETVEKNLADNGITVGLSLPIVTRGFDEVFSEFTKFGSLSETKWRVETEAGSLFCCAIIQAIIKQAKL